MRIRDAIYRNYLPYARMTIIIRAIPAIDGMKPVQRRILYSMYKIGMLNGDFKKALKVIGNTMSLHEHGDSSIFEALILMSDKYNGINAPYVAGDGNFGAKFSTLQHSQPRYVEVTLASIAKEFFDGINEGAVEMVDNFDSTEKEPSLLPSKFPNILVNANAGIAVGVSSNIPSFSLTHVCQATKGIILGEITNAEELADALVAPEYTTGGYIHSNKELMTNLCKTGKGTFTISGKVEIYSDKIIITEIPYTTTAEDIVDAIAEAKANNKLKGIKDVNDEIGIGGLRIIVLIKNGYSSREVLSELNRTTPLRNPISYRTRVIIGSRCLELGLNELLEHWIEFREKTIRNVYAFRMNKDMERINQLTVWEKVINDESVTNLIKELTDNVIDVNTYNRVYSLKSAENSAIAKDIRDKVVNKLKEVGGPDKIKELAGKITQSDTDTASQTIIKAFNITEVEAEYVLGMIVRTLTVDKVAKELLELQDRKNKVDYCNKVNSDNNEVNRIIVNELDEIINNYGKNSKTTEVPVIVEDTTKDEVEISDEEVVVVYTNGGYVRRLSSLNDIANKFVSKLGEQEIYRWSVKNNEHILVFDRFGEVHKILVDNIDSSSKAQMTDLLYKLAGLEKQTDMIYADKAGDYTGYFNIVYPNGRGERVYYSKAQGNRLRYKGLYENVEVGRYWITKENQFFLLTHRNKAGYCDITTLGTVTNRRAFKVASISRGDYYTKLIPYKDVPYKHLIDLERYNREYTVSIGKDEFYPDPDLEAKIAKSEAELKERIMREELEKNALNKSNSAE